MKRKEFISKLGIGAAFVLTSTCMSSCKKDPVEIGPVDLTIDLDSAVAEPLKNNGNYIIVDEVVIARGNNGDYLAATIVCSHAQRKEITFRADNEEWYCTAHGARYDLDGGGLNNKGEDGLTIFKTTLSGNMLTITN